MKTSAAVTLLLVLCPACCGQDDVPEGTPGLLLLDPAQLGNKEWDGDSYWVAGRDKKIRLLGIDYPDISDTNDLDNCLEVNSKKNCANWKRAFGGKLTQEFIDSIVTPCYHQGRTEIRKLLEGRTVYVVEDAGDVSYFGGSNDLRYIDFVDEAGDVQDLAQWLLERGYAIPWDDQSGYGECQRCDEYQQLGLLQVGCLWE